MDINNTVAMSMFMAQGGPVSGGTMPLSHKSPSPLSMDVRAMRLGTPAGPTPSPTSAGCSSAGCRSTLTTHAISHSSMPLVSTTRTAMMIPSQSDSRGTPLCVLPSSSTFVSFTSRPSQAAGAPAQMTAGRRSSPLEMTPPTGHGSVPFPHGMTEHLGASACGHVTGSGTMSGPQHYATELVNYSAGCHRPIIPNHHHEQQSPHAQPPPRQQQYQHQCDDNNSNTHASHRDIRLFYPLHSVSIRATNTATEIAPYNRAMTMQHANMFDDDDYVHHEDAHVGEGETGITASDDHAGTRQDTDHEGAYACAAPSTQQVEMVEPEGNHRYYLASSEMVHYNHRHLYHLNAAIHDDMPNHGNSTHYMSRVQETHGMDTSENQTHSIDHNMPGVAVETTVMALSAELLYAALPSASGHDMAAQTGTLRGGDLVTIGTAYAHAHHTHHRRRHGQDIKRENNDEITHDNQLLDDNHRHHTQAILGRPHPPAQHMDVCPASDARRISTPVTHSASIPHTHIQTRPTVTHSPAPPTPTATTATHIDTPAPAHAHGGWAAVTASCSPSQTLHPARKAVLPQRSHAARPLPASHSQTHPSTGGSNKSVSAEPRTKMITSTSAASASVSAAASAPAASSHRLHFSDRCGVVVSEYEETTHTRLAQYRCGALLGSGGYAQVYEFVELHSGARYACKVLDRARLSAAAEARVRREVAIHRTLHHPHVVHLHRCFSDAHYFYILLERCSRRNLKDVAAERGSFTRREIQRIMWQLASAVAYLHEHGVIHRDIKLGNIMIDSSGCRVKLGDFGFACRLGMARERRVRMCGTPNYIAPEILRSQETHEGYGLAVDVWSLGVVMFILTCGYAPFQSHDAEATYRRVRARRFAFPTPRHVVDESGRALIRAMLQPQPSRRCTAAEVLRSAFFRDPCVWLCGVRRTHCGSMSSISRHQHTACCSSVSTSSSSSSSPFSSSGALAKEDGDTCRERRLRRTGEKEERETRSGKSVRSTSTAATTAAASISCNSPHPTDKDYRNEEDEDDGEEDDVPPPPVRVHTLVHYAKYGYGFYLSGAATNVSSPPTRPPLSPPHTSARARRTDSHSRRRRHSRSTNDGRAVRHEDASTSPLCLHVPPSGAQGESPTHTASPSPMLAVLLNDKTKLLYDETKDRVYYYVRRPRLTQEQAGTTGHRRSASNTSYTAVPSHTYCDELHQYDHANETLLPKPTSTSTTATTTNEEEEEEEENEDRVKRAAGRASVERLCRAGAAKKLAIARCLQPYLHKTMRSEAILCMPSNFRHLRTPHADRQLRGGVAHTSGEAGETMIYVKEAVVEQRRCDEMDGATLLPPPRASASRSRRRGSSSSIGAERAQINTGGGPEEECGVRGFAVRLSNHSFQVTMHFGARSPACYHPLYDGEALISAGYPWSMDAMMYAEGRRVMFSLACESTLLYLVVANVGRDVHMCEDGSAVFRVWSTTSDRRTRLHLPTALLSLIASMLAKLRCPMRVLTGV